MRGRRRNLSLLTPEPDWARRRLWQCVVPACVLPLAVFIRAHGADGAQAKPRSPPVAAVEHAPVAEEPCTRTHTRDVRKRGASAAIHGLHAPVAQPDRALVSQAGGRIEACVAAPAARRV